MAQHTRPARLREAEPQAYTHKQICEMLGVSYNAVREQRLRGTLPFPAVQIGSQWRYPKAAVDRWLNGETTTSPDAVDG